MRRRVLLGALAGGPLIGCAKGPPPFEGVSVPLSRLPVGGRVQVMLKDEPVEVLRTEAGVVARSMLCTHFGCSVTWNAELGLYACACHEGRFSPEGRPVAGPPTLPLRIVPARIEGEVVLVEPPP